MQLLRERYREKEEVEKLLQLPSVFELEEKAKGNEELENLIKDLKISCLRYVKIRELEAKKKKKIEKEETLKSERQRLQELQLLGDVQNEKRDRHVALISNLNYLAKVFAQYNLDNSWRRNFISEEQIGNWAVKQAQEMGEIEFKEGENEIGGF